MYVAASSMLFPGLFDCIVLQSPLLDLSFLELGDDSFDRIGLSDRSEFQGCPWDPVSQLQSIAAGHSSTRHPLRVFMRVSLDDPRIPRSQFDRFMQTSRALFSDGSFAKQKSDQHIIVADVFRQGGHFTIHEDRASMARVLAFMESCMDLALNNSKK